MENNGGEWGGAHRARAPDLNIRPAERSTRRRSTTRTTTSASPTTGSSATAAASRPAGSRSTTAPSVTRVERNDICSNYSVEYGGGISHFGLSGGQTTAAPSAASALNRIYGNDAFDSGGGIMIAGEYPPGSPPRGRRSARAASTSTRNYISSNLSNDDGGGMMLLDTTGDGRQPAPRAVAGRHREQHDHEQRRDRRRRRSRDRRRPNVTFVNNTVARNASTDTVRGPQRAPERRRLRQRAEHARAPASRIPVAFFNNIFWNNEAFTWNGTRPSSSRPGMIDLEVYGTSGMLQAALLAA